VITAQNQNSLNSLSSSRSLARSLARAFSLSLSLSLSLSDYSSTCPWAITHHKVRKWLRAPLHLHLQHDSAGLAAIDSTCKHCGRYSQSLETRESVVVCLCLCVSMCSDVLGPLSLRISGYASSGTSAFSLHLMPSRLAAGAILTHSGSSAAPPPPPTPSHGQNPSKIT
jgi:hypothetical protein